MAKKPNKATKNQDKGRVRLPRSVSKRIRRLKSEGRDDEANALQRTERERKQQSG